MSAFSGRHAVSRRLIARFHAMWTSLHGIGRNAASGGYRRYAWTPADAD
ncbi:allantoate amidohydrolase, partial [Streptomyces sp. NPDC006197]